MEKDRELGEEVVVAARARIKLPPKKTYSEKKIDKALKAINLNKNRGSQIIYCVYFNV